MRLLGVMGKGKKNLNNGSDNSSNNLNEYGNNSATDMKTFQWIGSPTDENVDQREKKLFIEKTIMPQMRRQTTKRRAK